MSAKNYPPHVQKPVTFTHPRVRPATVFSSIPILFFLSLTPTVNLCSTSSASPLEAQTNQGIDYLFIYLFIFIISKRSKLSRLIGDHPIYGCRLFLNFYRKVANFKFSRYAHVYI
jgi:hypothetical protein